MAAKRIRERVMALFAVAVMLMTCLTATPAFAANVAPTSNLTTTFNKYLVMDENANVPPVTFTFTITPGSPVAANPDQGTPAILAGIGTPTVDEAAFTSADETTTGTPTDPSVSESKYATKGVTVDFSDVSFTAPGIYRYIITEVSSSHDGIANDGTPTRTLDVVVRYKDGSDTELIVSDYILYKGTKTDSTDAGTSGKDDGFTNKYATNDLTLEKQVTGNQGDRDKYFTFTVDIADAVAGTVYTVDLSKAEASLSVNGIPQTNPQSLTVEASGKITGTFYLKHGQSIVIRGLTSNTKYTITEDDYASDGYSTSYVIDSAVPTDGYTTGLQTMDADHAATFTNNKDGVIPTGILLETGPYMIMGAVVVVGLVALVATRRRQAR